MSLNEYFPLAKRRLMDLLAQREHTEAELRSKLSRALATAKATKSSVAATAAGSGTCADTDASTDILPCPEILEAVESALLFAREKRWLRDPQEVTEEVSARLHQKNKGIEYINTYLEGKGLPTIAQDSELELEKARSLVKNKYSDISEIPLEERPRLQARVARLLASRGFDSEIVRKVLYEKFGN